MSPLPPEVAERVAALSVRARAAATGLLTGLHRSPHQGASVVFAEHREYRPGDDPRLLDWRAFARTDRHNIKRFEHETQLRARLVLDRSSSMDWSGSSDRPTKFEHGATLLAALAYVLVRQGDAVGATIVEADPGAEERLAARNRADQLGAIFALLSRPPGAGRRTHLRDSLSRVAERAPQRGFIAVASDLLDDLEGLADGQPSAASREPLSPLGHLAKRGHDVLVFHTLDPQELDLAAGVPSRYEGLEGEEPIEAHPDELRREYQRRMTTFVEGRRRVCMGLGARYVLARTDEDPVHTLSRALAGR